MLQFLKTWRKFVVVPALLLISSLIWISNAREEKDRNFIDRTVVTLSAPLQLVVSAAIGGLKHVWFGYFYFVGVRDSNDALVRENDALRGKLALSWEVAIENERLRKMLSFEKEMLGDLLPASVIGADSASFAKSLRINRGSRDGVGRNMAVVTPSGVLGRVIEVSYYFSDVQLLTDGRSSVPVRVQRTRAQGVLEGLSKGLCHLKYVARAEDVQAGDVVITSGLGGIFPHGLVVGTVVNIEKKEFGVLQEVRVAPAVDFHRLPEEVLVVLKVPDPTGPDLEETTGRGGARAAPTRTPVIALPATATPTLPPYSGPIE